MHVSLETSLTGSELLLDFASADHVLFRADVLYAAEMTGKKPSHGTTGSVKLAQRHRDKAQILVIFYLATCAMNLNHFSSTFKHDTLI